VSDRTTPPAAVPFDGPVTLINAFTVPADESQLFLERWKDSARVMASQPGFVRARMLQSLVDTELAFVNVAEWQSGNALAQAQANPVWQSTVRQMLADPHLHVTARPNVYQVAIDVHAGDKLGTNRSDRG
jgi:heme-degrading monooxygenase HmoA